MLGPSMDSLPPEILRDIFLKTLPYFAITFRFPYSKTISLPLCISHVCRSWRKLALSIRELWSYRYIDTTNVRWKQELLVEIFDTWLARTNDGPINFTIDARPHSRATIDHECVEYMFTTLVKNQHRLREVDFICHDVKFSPRFPGFNLTNMPLLTSLNLNLLFPPHSVIDLTSSTRLKHLIIGRNNFDLVAGSRLPHLEQFELRFSYPKRESNQIVLSCLEFLRNAPSLRRVDISTEHTALSSSLPLDGERILLAGVREVSIMGSFDSHLPATIVDAVTLPSLESFTYRNNALRDDKLFRLFQRSAPPLTHLCLEREVVREEILIDILRLIPDLQHLMLCYATLSYRFFHELTVPDGTNDYTSAGDQIVCPGLSFLQLRYFSWDNSTLLEPLLTMTKSRAFILETFGTVTYFHDLADATKRTVPIADIDNYADEIQLSSSITFESLQSLDGA